MAGVRSLSKVLDVRENEKKVAQKEFIKSRDDFEEVATKLYHLLKKKEKAEDAYEEYITGIASLDKIKEQLSYIEKLNQHILLLQVEVQKKRSEMERKQAILTEAYVEVKKFESIIERRKEEAIENEKRIDNLQMDEISINQYMSHKN